MLKTYEIIKHFKRSFLRDAFGSFKPKQLRLWGQRLEVLWEPMAASLYIRSRCSLSKLISRVQLLFLQGLTFLVNPLFAINHQGYFSLKLKALPFPTLVEKRPHCLHTHSFHKGIYLRAGGIWLALLVKPLSLDSGSGLDFRVLRWSPVWGSGVSAQSTWDSPSPPTHSCVHALSLSK